MVAPVKLVMDIYVHKDINYLKNIVNCKFGNLYIYYNRYNLYILYIQYNYDSLHNHKLNYN